MCTAYTNDLGWQCARCCCCLFTHRADLHTLVSVDHTHTPASTSAVISLTSSTMCSNEQNVRHLAFLLLSDRGRVVTTRSSSLPTSLRLARWLRTTTTTAAAAANKQTHTDAQTTTTTTTLETCDSVASWRKMIDTCPRQRKAKAKAKEGEGEGEQHNRQTQTHARTDAQTHAGTDTYTNTHSRTHTHTPRPANERQTNERTGGRKEGGRESVVSVRGKVIQCEEEEAKQASKWCSSFGCPARASRNATACASEHHAVENWLFRWYRCQLTIEDLPTQLNSLIHSLTHPHALLFIHPLNHV